MNLYWLNVFRFFFLLNNAKLMAIILLSIIELMQRWLCLVVFRINHTIDGANITFLLEHIIIRD